MIRCDEIIGGGQTVNRIAGYETQKGCQRRMIYRRGYKSNDKIQKMVSFYTNNKKKLFVKSRQFFSSAVEKMYLHRTHHYRNCNEPGGVQNTVRAHSHWALLASFFHKAFTGIFMTFLGNYCLALFYSPLFIFSLPIFLVHY